MKLKITSCSFNELKEKLKSNMYDGIKTNSIFPYNYEALSNTGDLSVVLLAENTEAISILEDVLNEVKNRREVVS